MNPLRFNLRPEDGTAVADDSVNADGYVTDVRVPTLTLWRAPAARANGTGVIVCPGGGYEFLAVGHEGEEIARWLNGLGVTAFVLRYRVPRPGHPAPLADLFDAIRLVRARAVGFGVSPSRLGVLGSSAGGHLAASAGTLFGEATLRPDFLVLLYPVIALTGPFAHAGSCRALLGGSPDPAIVERLSLDRQVTARTPPAFLVHARDDTIVPPENSRSFHAALSAAGVASELHECARGFHGFGLGATNPDTARWSGACERWLRAHGWLNSTP